MIPKDPRKPLDPSGVRIGTPALTTRGMKEDEMRRIGEMILAVLKVEATQSEDRDEVLEGARKMVADLTARFPLYS